MAKHFFAEVLGTRAMCHFLTSQSDSCALVTCLTEPRSTPPELSDTELGGNTGEVGAAGATGAVRGGERTRMSSNEDGDVGEDS